MPDIIKLTVNEHGAGQRLDVFVSEELKRYYEAQATDITDISAPNLQTGEDFSDPFDESDSLEDTDINSSSVVLSRSAVAKLAEAGSVLVNGKIADKKLKLRSGDIISVEIPDPQPISAMPEDIPLDIIYEDNDIIIINKPVGMVVHPAAGNPCGTLVNALLWHCNDSLSGIGGSLRPGIVHRIDKDTSGLLAVAKNDMAHRALSEQLKDHSMKRVYHAIAIGRLREPVGTVVAQIGRHPTDRKKMAVISSADKKARHAVTHYSVITEFKGASYIKCELETGRTHQIRVHMSHLGHPLLGDAVYGGASFDFCKKHPALITGQCLHAKELILTHPSTKCPMHFVSPLPENFQKILTILEQISID